VIRGQDYLNTLSDDPNSIHYDHHDHYWSGWFAHDAVKLYHKQVPTATPAYWIYRGYNIDNDPSVALADYFVYIKLWTAYYYSFYDYQFCGGVCSILCRGWPELGVATRTVSLRRTAVL
jgi:hypothetical protein